MDFELMWRALTVLPEGLPRTLYLAGGSLLLGFFLAVLVALARVSAFRPLQQLAYGYVYVLRGTPLLVQIFLIYYGSGQFRPFFEDLGLWVFLREPYFCAMLALTLNTAAYTSEIIRGGIESVPFGQIEAARASGMSGVLLFRRIIFPVAIRQALPAYSNEMILMVKSTSLASTITILELTGLARKLISATFKPIEVFVVAGAFYLIINFLITRGVQWLEFRLSPHLRDRPEVLKKRKEEMALVVR